MQTQQQALQRLQRSRFRSKIHLSRKEREYVQQQGMDTIRRHACDFIAKRLAPAQIPNDGKQTPRCGHPVFKAQHACACCCRGCLNKWYRFPLGVEIPSDRQERIVNLLMTWIAAEMERGS